MFLFTQILSTFSQLCILSLSLSILYSYVGLKIFFKDIGYRAQVVSVPVFAEVCTTMICKTTPILVIFFCYAQHKLHCKPLIATWFPRMSQLLGQNDEARLVMAAAATLLRPAYTSITTHSSLVM